MARTTEKLEEVKESCEKLGSPEVTILEADMLTEDDLAKIAQEVRPHPIRKSFRYNHGVPVYSTLCLSRCLLRLKTVLSMLL